MSDTPAPTDMLYFQPLTRAGSRFVEATPEDEHGMEPTLVAEMETFIARFYERRVSDVDLNARSYRLPVYIPKEGAGTCYVIVDAAGAPPESKDVEEPPAPWVAQYAKWVTQKLAFSEGLARDQAAYIESEFLAPVLSEIDPHTHAATREISWEVASQQRRCVFLGAPGTGKTTLLRRVALTLSKQALEAGATTSIPIYIQLRDWEDEQSASRALAKLWADPVDVPVPDVTLAALYDAGRITLLLDGLDEVPDTKRSGISNVIARLAKEKPKLGILVAARTAGYDDNFEGFSHCVLRPFRDSHIYEWSHRRLYTPDRSNWTRFITHLAEVPQLKEVARNPFLLGLLVHFYRHNSMLPKDTSTLLQAYVRALAGEWDMVRGINRSNELWAAPNKKLSALCRLAYWLVDSGRSVFSTDEFCASERGLVELDTAAALLPTLAQHTGIVTRVGRGEDLWQFAHKTLVEFLAAYYLVERADDVSTVLGRRIKSAVWTDVWVYSCGLAQDATSLLNAVIGSRHASKLRKASLLARAFAQNLNIDAEHLKSGGDIIVGALEAALRGYSVDSVENQIRESVWSVRLRLGNPLSKKTSRQQSELAAVLREVYEARGGVFNRYLRVQSGKAIKPVLSRVLEALSFDGEFQTSAGSEGGLVLSISTPRVARSPR